MDGRTDKTHRTLTDCTWKWPQALPAADAALWLSRTHHPRHGTGLYSTAQHGTARLGWAPQGSAGGGRGPGKEAPPPDPQSCSAGAEQPGLPKSGDSRVTGGWSHLCCRQPPCHRPGTIPLAAVGRESFLQPGRNGTRTHAMLLLSLPGCIITEDFLSPVLFLFSLPSS